MKRFLDWGTYGIWGICLLSLLAVGVFVQGGDYQSLMQQANSAYLAGDYVTAAVLYEDAIAAGYDNEVSQFNLGSAYYQIGNTGQALVHFLRVQLALPRDPDLNTNIGRIRGERVDVHQDEQNVLDRTASVTLTVVTFDELALVGALVWMVCCGLGVGFALKPGWRSNLRPVLAVSVVVFSVMLVLIVARGLTEWLRPRAVVTIDRLGVYSGPDTVYLEMFELYEAAEVRVIDRSEVWSRVLLPDGRQGWVLDEGITFVIDPVR